MRYVSGAPSRARQCVWVCEVRINKGYILIGGPPDVNWDNICFAFLHLPPKIFFSIWICEKMSKNLVFTQVGEFPLQDGDFLRLSRLRSYAGRAQRVGFEGPRRRRCLSASNSTDEIFSGGMDKG